MFRTYALIGSVALVCVLALSGCSDSGNDTNENPGTSQAVLKYHYIVNDCDTKEHVFTATTMDEARKQMCEALQDDSINGNCFETRGIRRSRFESDCPGYKWGSYKPTPVQLPQPGSPQPQPNSPSDIGGGSQRPEPQRPAPADEDPNSNWPNRDLEEWTVRTRFESLLVDRVVVNEKLNEDDKKDAQKTAEDLLSCGVSATGPRCLDSIKTSVVASDGLFKVDDQLYFYAQVMATDVSETTSYVFKIEQIEPSLRISKIEVLKGKSLLGREAFASTWSSKSANLTLILSADISENQIEAALTKLKDPSDIRELYHVSQYLSSSILNPISRSKSYSTEIANALDKNSKLIVNSDRTRYQEKCLEIISDLLPNHSKLAQILEQFIESKEPNLKQIAAISLLDFDPKRTSLKPIVLDALKNDRWSIRYDAVRALGKIEQNLSTQEKNAVILMIGDSDSNVRSAANDVVTSFTLGETNLSTLEALTAAPSWSVRYDAVGQIDRIPGTKAKQVLLKHLNDSDSNVRSEVFSHLEDRDLDENDLEVLTQKFEAPSWSVRYDSAKLIGKIKGDRATTILITHMADSDSNVASLVYDELTERKLGKAHVSAISKVLDNPRWTPRYNAVKLLQKAGDQEELTNLLIQHLSDSDSNVRSAIFDALDSRTLKASSLKLLESHLGDQSWSVRYDTVKLIAKIQGSAATNALISALNDSDSNVRSAIDDALNARPLSKEFVAPLAKQFASQSWSVRYSVAQLLGKIKDPTARAALDKQLAQESDTNVKSAIKDSLDKQK